MTSVMSEPIIRTTISMFLSLYKHTGINYNERSFLQPAYSISNKAIIPKRHLSRHEGYKAFFTIRENTQLTKSCVLCSVFLFPAVRSYE